jgi:hypothetical protein
MQFGNNGRITNMGYLLKGMFQWLNDLCPELSLATANPDWKQIHRIADFPTKETDFLNSFAPTHARGSSGAVVIDCHIMVSTSSVEMIKKTNKSFVQYLGSKEIGLKTSCSGTKEETTILALLGFNPDRTNPDSLLSTIALHPHHRFPKPSRNTGSWKERNHANPSQALFRRINSKLLDGSMLRTRNISRKRSVLSAPRHTPTSLNFSSYVATMKKKPSSLTTSRKANTSCSHLLNGFNTPISFQLQTRRLHLAALAPPS